MFVSRAALRPVELPQRDVFKAAIAVGGAALSSDHICKAPAAAAPPAHAWLWRSHVRLTDCDELGHVNNTKYACLAEEALGFARNGGAFAVGSEAEALAGRHVVTMHIDYLEQLLPYAELCAFVWFDEASKAFAVRFESDGNGRPGAVAAAVVMSTVPRPRLRTGGSRL